MRVAMAVMLISGLLGVSCVSDGPVACTMQFVYGVNATVADATTGDPISGATLTLTEGDYVEVMEEVQDGSYVGAGERAGTYSLMIEADGFVTGTITGIVVTEDECHVIPRTVTITVDPM